jgi:hypothetical protein
MSNIFYSEVDKNLVEELNARGRAGKTDRSNTALDFMLGKIANAQITAYTGNDSTTPVAAEYGVIGGATVRDGRYLPSGPNGFLSSATYTTSSISFTGTADGEVASLVTSNNINDESRRVGPILTQLSVTVGDHSMGLLNKATVQISIPNPARDLEGVEATWFRPGRFVRIEIQHPESALMTKEITEGKLTPDTLPNVDKLKERYPGWNIDDILNQISYMNRYQFEGLITSFDFSYNEHMQIDATLNLTGTSNVFTDISMLMTSDSGETPKKANIIDISSNIPATLQTVTEVAALTPKPNSQLYETLDSIVTKRLDEIPDGRTGTGIISFGDLSLQSLNSSLTAGNGTATDHFILYGEPYDPLTNDDEFATFNTTKTTELKELQLKIDNLTRIVANTSSADYYTSSSIDLLRLQTQYTASNTLLTNISSSNANETVAKTFYNRYITLGALTEIVNNYILSKAAGSVSFSKIICSDTLCLSNYLPEMVSCIPNEIIFLPKDPADITIENSDINQYGTLAFYNKAIQKNQNSNDQKRWLGIYERTNDTAVLYPSRIFINMEFIQTTLNYLSANNTKNFTIKSFFAAISDRISYASGKSIEMKLVTLPQDESKLVFSDIKYIRSVDGIVQREIKKPYSIPMLANHPNGTIVKSFTFSAKLPESAKNLSYVLNQGDEVTEEQIAPYLNYMYSSKDPDKINAAIKTYLDKHTAIITKLRSTRSQLALSPNEPEFTNALRKDLAEYLKYPTPNLRESQQITAPIFPFDASFKIDGINGLRYGDILTFDALPLRYRVNTVFSIIGITHTVTGDGQWETEVRCIMRPNIE